MECVWRAVMLLSVYKAVRLGNETSLWVLLTGMVLLQAQFLQIKRKSWVSKICYYAHLLVLLNLSVASKNKQKMKHPQKNPNWPKKQNPTKQNNPNKPNKPKQTNKTTQTTKPFMESLIE